MNTAKLKVLEETFKNEFDIEKFQKFTREFFNEPDMMPISRRTGIWREYTDHVAAYYTIAKYTDSEDNNMIIMAVELKKNKSIERARSMQRNFISKVLDENGLEAAIVAFYSENEPSWRLSFVRLDYFLTHKGIELDLTPARRYSYLVGENEPNHTAQAQLLTIFEDDTKNPTLAEIEEAFSVEKVTKDFFNQYKAKYLDLKEHLEGNKEFISETEKLGFKVEKFSEQFAKKLMGQLAFLYFLQKKGWLGVRIMSEDRCFTQKEFKGIYMQQDQAHKAVLEKVFKIDKNGDVRLSSRKLSNLNEHEAELLSNCFVGTKYDMPWGSGNRTFIREIFNFCIENTDKNFFNDYLEPFFYDALNKKRKNHYFKRFNCKIPFLNGGLFEPIEGYHWKDVDFAIPNELFSNEREKGREANGILDILDRFNFTMNEDEPLEKEVAVDPEMLGKIFENLLDVSDRKSKGAFYTPREIVHYMCQESLINYLVNEVDVPYEDMKEFILYGEIIRDADNRKNVGYGKDFTIKQSIFDNIVNIDNALKNVKVADPAVGSGAFLLGMLNEIVKARNNITEYIIRKDKEEVFGIQYGEEFIRKIRSPYRMKIKTIRNSIFAVDIEPSAIDITKLRLWLAIVVDQEIDEENPDPHPLPNLDCNIMVGNSLIDEYEGVQLFDRSILTRERNNGKNNNRGYLTDQSMQMTFLIDQTDEMLKRMFDLQDRYFEEDNEDTKKEIKKAIDDIRDDLISYKLQKDGNQEGLKRYEESLKNKTKPYFIWELEFAKVFRDNGGFDIVIGNPPYVGEKGNKEIFRPIQKSSLGRRFYSGKMDLLYYFFHLGIDITKQSGIIAFITTNYFVTALGSNKLRNDMYERTDILNLVNFNELKIFESALGQHNMISILRNNSNQDNMALLCNVIYTNETGLANAVIIKEILRGKNNSTKYIQLRQDEIFEGDERYIRFFGNFKRRDDPVQLILNKINDQGFKLGDICDVKVGLRSGLDRIQNKHLKLGFEFKKNEGVFIVEKDKIDDNEFIEEEIVKPFFKNSDIKQYYTSLSSDYFVIYSKNDTKIQDYPLAYKHLLRYKELIEKSRWMEGVNWYALVRPRNEKIFLDEKIVAPQRSKLNTFGYNSIPWYASSDVYFIKTKNCNFKLKYVLALLNSKLYYLWLYYKGKRKGDMLELYQKPLSEIPIKYIEKEEQDRFIRIVDNILSITITEDYLKSIDKQRKVLKYKKEIDIMVYDLYKLSENEIRIVEEYQI